MTQTAYKHIAITEDGIPVIEGTRFKIKQLVGEKLAHGSSPEALQQEHPQLTLAQIYSALAYYEDHRDEIDPAIQEGEARAEALRPQFDSPDLKALVKARAGR
ncbi:MAG: DUF433 domain-containing protein [Deinococcota bacterium]|nr:DUF433 domain-containing protein [Deinococcota bacterium]